MDMTQCKLGDKLLLRNGNVAIMRNHFINPTIGYPYTIDINGVINSVTEEGLQLVGTTHPCDVVGFAPAYQECIDKVLEQIKADVINGDVTAIEELLKQVPIEILKSYLPEE